MAGDTFREVKVGGRTVTLEQFSGRKFTRSLDFLGAFFDRYGEITDEMASFRREYATKHPIEIPKSLALQKIASLRETLADPEFPEDMRPQVQEAIRSWDIMLSEFGERDRMTRPGTASTEEILMHIFPLALKSSEDDVARVLGIAAMSNEEVGEAKRAGNLPDQALAKGDSLLDSGTTDELLDLLVATGEMLLGDLKSRRERLGKLVGLFRPQDEAPAEEPQTTTSAEDSTLSEPSSPSPTDSPESTDGPLSTASTESATETLSASST